MKIISVKNYIKDMEDNHTLLVPAIPDNEGIQIIEYEDFLKLISLWKVPVVFHQLQSLEEFDIDSQLIIEEDLNRRKVRYIKEKFAIEAQKFNDALARMRVYIGEILYIKLFFAYEGKIYYFDHSHDELYPEDKEEFIKDLLEQFEDDITTLEEKERKDRSAESRKRYDNIREFLIEHEEFHLCTNVGARKAFMRNLDDDPNSPVDLSDIPNGIWYKLVEEAWEQVKLKKVRTKK